MKIPLNKIEEVQLLQRQYNQTVIKIREIMEESKGWQPTKSIKYTVERLIEALKEDEQYYISWKASIAMAFQDEYERKDKELQSVVFPTNSDIHEVSNNAADNFLKQLIG